MVWYHLPKIHRRFRCESLAARGVPKKRSASTKDPFTFIIRATQGSVVVATRTRYSITMKLFLTSLLFFFQHAAVQGMVWNRVATFLACVQDDPNCNLDNQTVAEIVSVTPDGMTLIYTDSASERLGFIDITDASSPVADGVVDLAGEPTSVSVTANGLYALASVNTSPDFVNPSGVLQVIEISSRNIVHEIDLQGQPDSIDTSPDGNYLVICIENERDEDLEATDGRPPQLPAGFIWVIDTNNDGDPTSWVPTRVEITNLPGMLFPEDPEPEFVDINANNVAVVSLQENNHLVLIDLANATVLDSYPAGATDLDLIDIVEEDVIDQSGSLTAVLREPDALTWIGTDYYATADEGDLDGGSRTFTIYSAADGAVVYDSGNILEHVAVQYGHYPEGRSENKGTEPEGILYFEASDGTSFLAVLLERAGAAVVFTLPDISDIPNNPPVFAQVLPTLLRPEGIVKVPGRDIIAVSCEEDARGDKVRAGVVIYEYQSGDVPTYPALKSDMRENDTPIPFSALSGLAAAVPAGFPVAEARRSLVGHGSTVYTIEDSAYKQSRILEIDTASFPYTIKKEMRIMDSDGILKEAFPEIEFNNYTLVNDDMTVNMDPEGIAVSYSGGYWVANEGRGTVGEEDRPIEMHNFIIKVDDSGVIKEVVTLPDEVNAIQVRFGFEGVAEEGDYLVVAFQRKWGDEANPRIGIYSVTDKTWTFVFYPLDDPASQAGGWVGLSDISPLGCGNFLVVERDNQGGPDAAIKKIFKIDLGDLSSVTADTTIEKEEFYDLMPDLESLNGYTYEKIEGMAVFSSGRILINNDNDGVDDNSGEQYMFELDGVTAEIVDECDFSTSSAFGVAAGSIATLLVSVAAFVLV